MSRVKFIHIEYDLINADDIVNIINRANLNGTAYIHVIMRSTNHQDRKYNFSDKESCNQVFNRINRHLTKE